MALLRQYRTEDDWKQFFLQLTDIPTSTGETYAAEFAKNRITEKALVSLDKQDLKDLNVDALGDVKTILSFVKSLNIHDDHNEGLSRASSSHVKMNPQEVPKIKMGMTRIEFAKFRHDWSNIKVLANIPQKLLTRYLYTACDQAPTVQNSILYHHPKYADEEEASILDYIEEVVTKDSNKAVYRLQFRKLEQASNESAKSFITRLQQNADPCDFVCPHCKKSTAECHIRDQFLIGLSSSTIQRDLMAEDSALDTNQKLVNRATQLEVVASDQTILSTQQSTAVLEVDTRYKKPSNKHPRRPHKGSGTKSSVTTPSSSSKCDEKCAYCGKPGYHGTQTYERKKRCPAFGKKCRKCNKMNHLEHVCLSRETQINEVASDSDEYSDDAQAILLAGVHSSPEIQEIPVTLTPDVHKDGTFAAQSVQMNIFPDSGAGICLADEAHAQKMGIDINKLTQCYKRVKAVGGGTIICRRVIPVRFTYGTLTTVQNLYFTFTKLARMYFSRKGCLGLKILPKSFPYPMTTTDPTNVSAILNTSDTTTSKSAPKSSDTINNGFSKSDNFRRTPPDRPKTIPFQPTEANVPLLKQFLLDSFSTSAFDRSAPFPIITGPPAHIQLTDDAKPTPRHTANKIPHHLRKATEKGVYTDVERLIIRPIPIGTPTKHCHAMVIGEKKNGTPRRTIDFRPINKYIVRETHHVPSPFDVASEIPPGTKKTIVDAVDGYHSVILDEESQLLTTFITPFTPNARFCYVRCPQGLTSANDYYNARYDKIIQDFPRKAKIVDDVALWADSVEQSFWHTWDFLTLCVNNGIVLNKDKFQFCQDTVEFAGLKVNKHGVAPSDKILTAIQNFPVPKDIHGARAWMGLVNQTAWAFAISDIMQPFRELVKPKQTFQWNANLQHLFDTSKQKLIQAVKDGVHAYDVSKPTCIQCDWSKHGVGYLLYQKHCKCDTNTSQILNCCDEGWKLVFAGSRCTSDAETRYAPTEGEALAVAYSLNHAHSFVYGCPNLTVVTDHKPLLGIFGDRDLGTIQNPRIQRLKEQTLRYKFNIVHCPGKLQVAADALSRYPVGPTISEIILDDLTSDAKQQSYELENEVNAVVTNAVDHLSSPDGVVSDIYSGVVTIDTIENAAKSDEDYKKLIEMVNKGFPYSKHLCHPSVKCYWDKRHCLTSYQNIVLMNDCIVVPKALRRTILHTLHSAHQGCQGMLTRAQTCVYWPQMRQSILNFRADCKSCQMHAPSLPKEPYIPTEPPKYPFQKICSDYCSIGNRNFLIIADRFSGWLHIYGISRTASADNLIKHCRKLFADYGTPEEMSTDGGPQFVAEKFEQFLKIWAVKHRNSSAYYPQSNGRAEVAVKSAKKILRDHISSNGTIDNDGFAKAILQYRNTPLDGIELSPAQLLFNRNLRDFIPTHPKHYKLSSKWIELSKQREQQMADRNKKLALYYNNRSHPLPPLSLGSHVLVQNKHLKRNLNKWTLSGRIVEILHHRQYKVKMDGSGRVTIRNRRHLRSINPSLTDSTSQMPMLKYKDPNKSSTPEMQQSQHTTENDRPIVVDDPPPENTAVPDAADASRPSSRAKVPRALSNLRDHILPGAKWHPRNMTRRSSIPP